MASDYQKRLIREQQNRAKAGITMSNDPRRKSSSSSSSKISSNSDKVIRTEVVGNVVTQYYSSGKSNTVRTTGKVGSATPQAIKKATPIKKTTATVGNKVYDNVTLTEVLNNKLSPFTSATVNIRRTNLRSQALKNLRKNERQKKAFEFSLKRLETGVGTSRDLLQVLSGGTGRVQNISLSKDVAKGLASQNEAKKFERTLYNNLTPQQKARYRLLKPGREKANYLLTNQPKTFLLSPDAKIVKGKIVPKYQGPEIKATNLVISKVKKIPWKTDKGTARLLEELNNAKVSLEFAKGPKGTFKNQIYSALGNTVLGAGRGVVNLLTFALNPIDSIKNFSNFIVQASKDPSGVAKQIANAFIEDPYGYIGETVTEGYILGKAGQYSKQSKVARYINEERFIRSVSPKYRDAVRKIIKGTKAQEKLAPGKGSYKKVDFFEVRELNPIEAKALQKTLRETDSVVFGSVSARTLSGKKTKLPKDVDLATKNIQVFNKKFMDSLPKASRRNYKISKEKIVRISDGAKILDVKPFDRLYPNKLALSRKGELPIYKLDYKKGKKPVLKQVPTIFTTQKPVKVGGIKLTTFGEQTTRKALGTLQVILEKAPRRAKDPSALLEALEIQYIALKKTKPKTKIGKLRKASKLKKLNSAIKVMKSKDFAKLLESKVPGLTKEYPLVSKINVKKLKNLRVRKPTLTKKDLVKKKIAKAKVSKNGVKKAVAKKTIAKKKVATKKKVPSKAFSRLPKSKVSRLPVSKISRLPVATISKLPIKTISRLPIKTISRLPVATISKLPTHVISKLPIATISRLPITNISKLPTTTISRLPTATISKLPLPTISKLPIAVKRKVPVTQVTKRLKSSLDWKKKLPPGYRFKVNGYVKVGKRKVLVAKGLPINKAWNKVYARGSRKYRSVDNSVARSFEFKIVGITKAKDELRKIGLQKVRSKISTDPKVLKFVEKSKYAIDKRGEKQGLKIAKRKKRK